MATNKISQHTKKIGALIAGIILLIMGFASVAGASDTNPVTSAVWYRQGSDYFLNPTGTINVAGCNGCGGGSSFNGVTTDGTTVVGDGLNTPLSAIFNQQGNQLLSGGSVWSGTGYKYNVSQLTYYFQSTGNGTSAPTTVTLPTADPTNGRFDAITVDENGTVGYIMGTPSGAPAYPVIPGDHIAVSYVFVGAMTTQPTVLVDNVYQEGTEWTPTNYTTSGTPTGTTNFLATNSCQSGTKCIDNLRDGRTGDLFTRSSDLTFTNYTTLQVYVRFTTAIATNKSLVVQFRNSSNATVGTAVNLFTYGLNRSVLNTWQLVVVPRTAFGTATTVRKMTAILSGGTAAANVEWDLDNIALSNGTQPVILSPAIKFQKDGVDVGTQAILNFLTGTGNTLTVTNDAGNNRVNVEMDGAVTIGSGSNSGGVFTSGIGAGAGALNGNNSIFLGNNAGANSNSSDHSVFIGDSAGQGAINASQSVFLGYRAGYNLQMTGGGLEIAIGANAGANDTNNNPNTLIGPNTSAGSNQNDILLGAGGTMIATTSNSFLIDPVITNATFPNATLTTLGTVNTGGSRVNVTVIANDTNYSVIPQSAGIAGDFLVEMKPATTNVTATLPASPVKGDTYTIKNTVLALHNVTVAGNGHNIDGSASDTITGSVTIESAKTYTYDGSQWSIN